MENKVITIRQSLNSFAKALNLKLENDAKDKELTTHPSSFRIYYPRKGRNGAWITGLTEEEQEKFGKILGKDLSGYSDYWESFQMILVNKNNEIVFNLNRPLEFITYKCALANKFVAPTKKDLIDDEDLYKDNCFLYVYDPEGEVRRENTLSELKDECTSKIFLMKNQKEKMFYVLAKTQSLVNETWSEAVLYKTLREYLGGLNTIEKLEKFKSILETDSHLLTVEYIVNKELTNPTVVKYEKGQYIFGDKILGSSKAKAVEAFLKNDSLFSLLMEELENK